MTRRVYNLVVDESGKPIEGVEVHVSLNRTTYKDTIEVAKFGVLAKTDRRGYWEISLHANDTLDDPNSFYTVEEIKNGKRIATHYIRVPSSTTYTEPIHIKQIETTPLPVTPPPNVVTGIATDTNQFLRGDVRLLAGTGIQLQQDNSAKTITIVNTGGEGGSAHNLLSDTHSDAQPTAVQRGMLIVGRLVAGIVKWAGLALGAAGKFLKSTGTDVVWGDVDWTEVQNKPSTFPPSPHTHDATDIASGRLSASRLPTSPNANRFLVVRTANSDPTYDVIQASDLPSHTHTPSQISPQGSGSGLDADMVDGQHASAFARASHTHNAADVAAGQFGANTGGGDYSFPGKVGIGTATPQTQLHVIGMIRVGGVASGGGVQNYIGASSGIRAPVTIQNNAGDYIQMEIRGSAEPGTDFGLPTAGLAYIRVSRPSGTAPFVIGTQYNGPLIFVTNNTERMRIDGAGSVGIGTTAPTARLHVAGSTGYNQLRLQTPYTPTSSTDPNGNVGDIAWDDNYIYVKTSTGWKRAALSTF
jgi:hypothetical protein